MLYGYCEIGCQRQAFKWSLILDSSTVTTILCLKKYFNSDFYESGVYYAAYYFRKVIRFECGHIL